MVEKLVPEINKVYFINKYTLIHILSGDGGIQVDFNNYFDWHDKIIYLEKGQYIKFLSEGFLVRKIEFPDEAVFHSKEIRVLFKHLISLGYINFDECKDCQKYLENTAFSNKVSDIIDISSKQWYWQNPFHANKDEYQVIFDVKDVVDKEFKNHLNNKDLSHLINENGYNTQALVKNKIGISVKSLLTNKRLIESKKEIAFTDKNIQEISYDLGYKDPAYFNRVFKKKTGQNPVQFRRNFDYSNRDVFTQDIINLVQQFHNEQHALGFYADKMNVSIKTLSKKVKHKMNTSLGQLIRSEIIQSAKMKLSQNEKVKDVAYVLGFEEVSHFSSFFTNYVGIAPSTFKK